MDINIGDKFKNTQNGIIGTIIKKDDTVLETPFFTIEYEVQGIFGNETLTDTVLSKVFILGIEQGVIIKI